MRAVRALRSICGNPASPEHFRHHIVAVDQLHFSDKLRIPLVTSGLRIVIDARSPGIGNLPMPAHRERQSYIFHQGITLEVLGERWSSKAPPPLHREGWVKHFPGNNS